MPDGMPPQGKAPKMARGKNSAVPMVRGGGSAGSITKPGPIQFWVQNRSYFAGEQVIFGTTIFFAKGFIPEGFPFSVNNFQVLGDGAGAFGNTVIVATANGDYADLATALTDPKITGASVTTPASILIYPGIYDEPNFIIPSFVDIIAVGGVTLRPQAAITSVFCEVKANATIQLVRIDGNGNAGGLGAIGVQVNSGNVVNITEITAIDFHVCFSATGAGSIMLAQFCNAQHGANDDVNIGFQAIADADMTPAHPTVLGKFATRIPIAYYATGNGSVMNTSAGSAVFAQEAVVLDDLAQGTINSLSIAVCDKGLVTRNNGGATQLRALNVSISTSTPIHHQLDDNNVGAIFESSGGRIDSSKIIHSANVQLLVASIDEKENDQNFRIIGEISQGTPARPSEAHFGSGDSTTTSMTVQTNTNGEIGAWVDETADAASPSGSLVTMFPGVAAENTIYFGRANTFGGFKLVDLDTLMVPGAGAIVFEYWNGSAWVAVNVMETDDFDLDDVRASNVFVTNVNGDLQLRTGDTTGWTTKNLNGITKFWLRVRISTAITTSPIFQQSKLHTNSFQIDSNGLKQLQGEARFVALDLFPRLEDLVGFSAANNDVNSSTNTGIQTKNNNRANSAKDGSGVTIVLPNGIDTSFPVKIEIRWSTINNGVGDVENAVAISKFSTGDIIDGTLPETVQNIITSLNAQQFEVQLDTFTFDISDLKPGDNINIGSFRDATGGNLDDTFAAATYVVSMTAIFRRWR